VAQIKAVGQITGRKRSHACLLKRKAQPFAEFGFILVGMHEGIINSRIGIS
jgi:hypothetical protein